IVRLWDAKTGKELRSLSGHTDVVRGVAFSPDGRTLATASSDKSVKLWDADSGQLVRTLNGHEGPVDVVAFSLDGRTLATGSEDKTIRIVDARLLTPALRVLREVQGVIEFLFEKHLPVAEVLDRIHNDPSLSAEVRSRALELAESYGQSLVTQEAERVVNEL